MDRLGYRPALDGLRAVAITGVVSSHVFSWPRGGVFGVDLFFVLSGFLITTLLLEEREHTGRVNLRAFYVRRARRLLPALAVMVVTYMAAALAMGWESTGRVLAGSASAAGYVANFTMAYSIEHMSSGLSHTWSLAAEEQFYLVWPVLLLLVLRSGRRAAIVLLFLVIIGVDADYLVRQGGFDNGVAFSPEYRSTIALAVGCLFAAMGGSPRLRSVARVVAPVAVIMLAIAFGMELRPTFGTLHPVFCIAAGMVILAVLEPGPLARVLGLTPFAWLGRISYSLYLWHLPALMLARREIRIGGSASRDIVGLAVSFGFAIASYYLVESRFRRPRLQRREIRIQGRQVEPARG